jgi:hypothetical protein
VARVVREGFVRDNPYGGKQESVEIEAEQLSTGDRVLSAPVGIPLTISASAEEEEAREAGADSALRLQRRRTAAFLGEVAHAAESRQS